jgi:predicted O-methyltransferase YrrM
VIASLSDTFDFIFLDCAKVQYVKYLPTLKKLLKRGGVLVADDVLLYGWVNGENPVPPKRKMLATHIREYIDLATQDKELLTSVINVGDGIALSVKV